MSAPSNKSRMVLFLMVIISIAFLITSFLTAALTNDGAAQTRASQPQGASPGPLTSAQNQQVPDHASSNLSDCFIFKTVDGRINGECSHS